MRNALKLNFFVRILALEILSILSMVYFDNRPYPKNFKSHKKKTRELEDPFHSNADLFCKFGQFWTNFFWSVSTLKLCPPPQPQLKKYKLENEFSIRFSTVGIFKKFRYKIDHTQKLIIAKIWKLFFLSVSKHCAPFGTKNMTFCGQNTLTTLEFWAQNQPYLKN